jgi:hypothetical protein
VHIRQILWKLRFDLRIALRTIRAKSDELRDQQGPLRQIKALESVDLLEVLDGFATAGASRKERNDLVAWCNGKQLSGNESVTALGALLSLHSGLWGRGGRLIGGFVSRRWLIGIGGVLIELGLEELHFCVQDLDERDCLSQFLPGLSQIRLK